MTLTPYLLALLAAVVAVRAGPSDLPPSGGRSFSLAVAKKPGHTRDFVRDWVAAHQRWGKGVSEEIYSMFSLTDGGETLPNIAKAGWCLTES